MPLTCSIQSRSTYLALVVGSVATLAAVGAWLAASVRNDSCALPAGAAALDASAQAVIARHTMACRDLEHGRITRADYRTLILDQPRTPAMPAIQWASSVRGFSSEYSTTSWSAAQALGAPNVYPASGDIVGAWASRDPDGSVEFLEVGFAQPQQVSALKIYETFNPGAITHVELITESGARLVVPRRELQPQGGAAISTFGSACTTERVVAARIAVASHNVAGWNEIDAVGVLPCQPL